MKKAFQFFLVLLIATTFGCKISGTVTDGDGNPVEGAVISLEGAASLTTTTDSNGDYSFSDLGNGSYTVSAEYEDMDFVYPSISTKIFFNNKKIHFVEYIPPEPALYNLGACNENDSLGLHVVKLYSSKVENLGLGDGTIYVQMEITQTETADGSSEFTCTLIDYEDAVVSGYIDGDTYIADTFPEDGLTITFNDSISVKLEIRSLTLTATDNCSFEGTANVKGTYAGISITDTAAEISTDI